VLDGKGEGQAKKDETEEKREGEGVPPMNHDNSNRYHFFTIFYFNDNGVSDISSSKFKLPLLLAVCITPDILGSSPSLKRNGKDELNPVARMQ
jgi:hypothetical protein